MFQVIARTNELLENSAEQRRKQEKALEEKQEQVNKIEANMKSVTGDVIKVSETCVFVFFFCSSGVHIHEDDDGEKFISNLRMLSSSRNTMICK